MKVWKTLELEINKRPKTIYFGQPSGQKEMEGMYGLRYEVYARKKYIYESRYPARTEQDEYDVRGESEYFVAKMDDKMIGTVRMIKSDPLPTQLSFLFDTPREMSGIEPRCRCELSRLIVIPPDREKGVFLPRRLVLLIMVSVLVDYSEKHSILGGYAFVKNSLKKKINKLNFPVHLINDYEQIVKEDNPLFKYFMQEHNPVVPVFFLTNEFRGYINKIFEKKWLLKGEGSRLAVNSNVYTRFMLKYNIL